LIFAKSKSFFRDYVTPIIVGTSFGFSINVIQKGKTNDPESSAILMIQGFNQKPTVSFMLGITNPLLEGKLLPSPTAP
jgi:hypothetical protein